MSIEEEEFDLFGELSATEQELLEHRRQTVKDQLVKQLDQLSPNPNQRTTAENRFVFHHKHASEFQKPGLHSKLLSPLECQSILDICRTKEDAWTTARHSAFATTDIPIRTDPHLDFLEPLIKQRLFPELAHHYGFRVQELEFRDIFLVKYSARAQRGLKLHTDGCLFSLTLLISHPNDFEGGGTFFKSINDVVYLNQGDCAYHDARVLHSGMDITKGERYILVAFIDTIDTIHKDNRAMLRG